MAAFQIDQDSIREVYDDVRADNTETEWGVFMFEDKGKKLSVKGSGKGFDQFKDSFNEGDRGFGFCRINTGDEMSKRAKFVMVTWVGTSVSPLQRAKMSTDKSVVKQIIQSYAVDLQLEDPSEIDYDDFKRQVDKAGGANYGTGQKKH